jgi:7 transmembrane helices usually fused to an inactive transglutaminase/Inactive transglutaminase fused to 7 transmembrane helices
VNKTHIYLLALILTVIGLGLFLYKTLALHFPLAPEAESYLWNLETRITFEAGNEPVKVSTFIPANSRNFAITNDYFISRGYGLTTGTEDSNRTAVWSLRRAKGLQTLYYRGEAHQVETKEPPHAAPSPPVPASGFTGADLTAAEALVGRIQRRSADTESMVGELINTLNRPQGRPNATMLLGQKPTESDKMNLVVRVLALAGVSARTVHGVVMKDHQEKVKITHWLEVLLKKRWQPFNPVTGARGVPNSYLAWWRGPGSLVSLKGGKDLKVNISISRNLEEAMQTAVVRSQIKRPILLRFSLLSLPLHTQQVFRVLLLVPVGAFILVVFRNLIGFVTFGTFMPVLIALAFRETELLWGIVFFSVLVGLGLTVRFYLEQLKLLLVPRLAAILIVVVALLAVVSILAHKIGLERGLSVALFPMVIMTMTIERMSIVWEERGPGEAMKQGIGSLAAASLAYLVMHQRHVQHLFFVFPELLLLLLAATLLLGRYSGYRLVELWRFRAILKEKS